MLTIDIPGYKRILAQHLVIDFNGTLAIDGKLIEGTASLLKRLADNLTLHILTADTFDSARFEVHNINCRLEI
jgi:soluble P-type ATPase